MQLVESTSAAAPTRYLLLAAQHLPRQEQTDAAACWVGGCAAAREHVVGWYSTGPRLREADLSIHQLMSNYVTTPVLVICEVEVSSLPGPPAAAAGAVQLERGTSLRVPWAAAAQGTYLNCGASCSHSGWVLQLW